MHNVCLNNYLSFNFKIKLEEENIVKLHDLPLPSPLSLTILKITSASPSYISWKKPTPLK